MSGAGPQAHGGFIATGMQGQPPVLRYRPSPSLGAGLVQVLIADKHTSVCIFLHVMTIIFTAEGAPGTALGWTRKPLSGAPVSKQPRDGTGGVSTVKV